MNNTFLERLRHNTLTDSDQYRAMKKTLEPTSDQLQPPVKEDWKNWQLVPVHAGSYSQATTNEQGYQPDASQVLKAIDKLN